MTNVELSVYRKSNNQYVETIATDDKTDFGLTINAFNISDPEKAGSSYSNSIKIPVCATNDYIFGNPNINLINNSDTSPYTAYYIKIRYNSVDINLKYDIRLTGFDYKYYSIALIKSKSIFDEMKLITVDSLLCNIAQYNVNYQSYFIQLNWTMTYSNLYRMGAAVPMLDYVALPSYGMNNPNIQHKDGMIGIKSPMAIRIGRIFEELETLHNIKVSYKEPNEYLNKHFLLLPGTTVHKSWLEPFDFTVRSNITRDGNPDVPFFFLPEKLTVYDLLKEIAKLNTYIIDDISVKDNKEIYLGDIYKDLNNIINLDEIGYKITNRKFTTDKQGINNYIKFGGLDKGQNKYYGAYNLISNNRSLENKSDLMTFEKTFLPTEITDTVIFTDPFTTHNFDPTNAKSSIEDSFRIFTFDENNKTTATIKLYGDPAYQPIPISEGRCYKYMKPEIRNNFYVDIFGNTEVLEVEVLMTYFDLFVDGKPFTQYETIATINDVKYFINKVSNFQFGENKTVKLELVRMDNLTI